MCFQSDSFCEQFVRKLCEVVDCYGDVKIWTDSKMKHFRVELTCALKLIFIIGSVMKGLSCNGDITFYIENQRFDQTKNSKHFWILLIFSEKLDPQDLAHNDIGFTRTS